MDRFTHYCRLSAVYQLNRHSYGIRSLFGSSLYTCQFVSQTRSSRLRLTCFSRISDYTLSIFLQRGFAEGLSGSIRVRLDDFFLWFILSFS